MIYDINLLPKSKKTTSTTNLTTVLALVFCCVSIMFIFGYFLPKREESKLEKRIEDQKQELDAYAEVEIQYQQLLAAQQEKQQLADSLDKLKNNNMKFTELLDDIEKNIPEGVYFVNCTFGSGLLTIDAYAPSYENIAQFMVKTRKIKNILGGTFTQAVLDKKDISETEGKKATVAKNGEDGELYRFSITLLLDKADIFAELQGTQEASAAVPTPAPEESSNGGEGADNATN